MERNITLLRKYKIILIVMYLIFVLLSSFYNQLKCFTITMPRTEPPENEEWSKLHSEMTKPILDPEPKLKDKNNLLVPINTYTASFLAFKCNF